MSQNKMFSFLLSDENKKYLKELSEKQGISIGKILNSIVSNYSNKPIEKISISNDDLDTNSKTIEVRCHLKKEQYLAIKELAKKEFLSVRRYIMFLISQQIYDKNIPANSEIIELQNIKNELTRLGININQISKKINIDKDNFADKETIELLQETLKNIKQDRENYQHKISIFQKINDSRF